jgi:hypothetical protein
MEFDLLIEQPIKRLIQEGQMRKLNIRLRKNFKLSIPITHALNAKTEPIPKEDPIKEVKVVSLDNFNEPNLKDDAQFFIEEEEENPMETKPLDELLEPPKPTIKLKPLPSGLRYAFLDNDQDSLVIISDKLSHEESLCLLTALEKHCSTFGYSLQDPKGISPTLCTHRIPIDPTLYLRRSPKVGLIMR